MRSGVLTILAMVVVGVVFANIIANPTGTKAVADFFVKMWQTSVNGLLARTSTGSGPGKA